MTSDAINSDELTIHSASIAEIYDIPIDQIIRPLPSILDQCKVDSLVNTLKVLMSLTAVNSVRHTLGFVSKLGKPK
jgi:uncharacterized ParB-like nuclease family protein